MGPRAIRSASARHLISRSSNTQEILNPYTSWLRVVDCGDIPIAPFDNAVAVRQMTEAYRELGERKITRRLLDPGENGVTIPRLITPGGDHLVGLPALRALREKHSQPLVLLHFDSHIGSLHPDSYPLAWASDQTQFNHGSVFWKAGEEGLICNKSSVHAGIITRLGGATSKDLINDDRQGFLRISADVFGVELLERKLQHTSVLTSMSSILALLLVSLRSSLSGTGAPEPGGWTTREMMKMIRGVNDLNIVGADIVEFAPAYDSAGGDTAFITANFARDIYKDEIVKA